MLLHYLLLQSELTISNPTAKKARAYCWKNDMPRFILLHMMMRESLSLTES